MPERPTTTPRDRGESVIERVDRETPVEMQAARALGAVEALIERALPAERRYKAVVDERDLWYAEWAQITETARVLQERAHKMQQALQYITSPTMGRPGDIDAYDFAAEGSTEAAARYALQICIRMARAALDEEEEWHYTDCGIAGGFPHKASDHT